MQTRTAVVFGLLFSFAASFANAAEPAKVKEIKQYGITWTLAEPAMAGQYVTGDWWVIGPVTVERVSPIPGEGTNGSVVNPPAGESHGYDARLSNYDASLAAKFPLALKPDQSLVSTVSRTNMEGVPADAIEKQARKEMVIITAAVLTCVAEAPPADAFRPAYVGDWKQTYRVSQLHRERLPGLKAAGDGPDVKALNRTFQRIWLDHKTDWPSRFMHPLENMPGYGREITTAVSDAVLALMLENPDETLLINYVQKGIDSFGVTKSDNDLWIANGGHNSGRKWPILFAGIMLGDEAMQNVNATFQEDQQTYEGKGFNGQTALWSIRPGVANEKHEEADPATWETTFGKGANNGKKAEAYRKLNGPTWIGQALAARLMGAQDIWNHPVYFAYVDRWVEEEGDDAFGNHKFVEAMWNTYRDKADKIAADRH